MSKFFGPYARNIDEEAPLPTMGDIRKSFDTQVGGAHYNTMGIQPVEFLKANLSHVEYMAVLKGNVLKYTFREKGNDLEDYRKARHYIDMMIEEEEEFESD
jgi:hypothetical protein